MALRIAIALDRVGEYLLAAWKAWAMLLVVPPAVAFLTAWYQAGVPFDRATLAKDLHLALGTFVGMLIGLLNRSPQDAVSLRRGTLQRVTVTGLPLASPPATT